MDELSPIAIFAYRRADSLRRVLDALEQCPEIGQTMVYAFSDGARDASDSADVCEVRSALAARAFPFYEIIASDRNQGLDTAILNGISHVLKKHRSIIVLEDDVLLSPMALTWMNAGLVKYEHEQRVMQISAHAFDAPKLRQRENGLFLPMPSSWGWATWREAWREFRPMADGWNNLLKDRRLARRFDLAGAFPYSRLLRTTMSKTPSDQPWDIRWYWTMFCQNGICLYPPRTLALNVGTDALASHSNLKRKLLDTLRKPNKFASRIPVMPDNIVVEPDVALEVYKAIRWRRV